MARIFTTGAEEPDISLVWDQANLSYVGNTEESRTGRSCYWADDTDLFRKSLDNLTEVYLGIAIKQTTAIDGGKALFRLACGSFLLQLYLGTDGSLHFTTPTAQHSPASLIAIDAWHYMEVHFKPLNTGGVLQVKLDGNLVIDYSGDTTNNAEYVTEFVLRGTDQGKETYYDDIVLNDASGSYNNSWPGQVHLLPIQAAGEGDTTQFTRAGVDLGENFAQVRPLTPIQSYVQSDTADEIDLYAVDVPDLPSGATIKNVIASALGRIVTGSGSMALLCKQGGNTTTGSDKALSAGWTMDQEVFAVNPADDAAWEEADLSGLQLGIKSR